MLVLKHIFFSFGNPYIQYRGIEYLVTNYLEMPVGLSSGVFKLYEKTRTCIWYSDKLVSNIDQVQDLLKNHYDSVTSTQLEELTKYFEKKGSRKEH